jgi:predicted transcriptional regulator
MEKKNEISLELKEDVAEGIYSNLAVISHSSSEFIVDFVRLMPGINKAQVKSRIILTPEHAKRLLYALQENIAKYEATNGQIKVNDNQQGPTFPMGFGSSKIQA